MSDPIDRICLLTPWPCGPRRNRSVMKLWSTSAEVESDENRKLTEFGINGNDAKRGFWPNFFPFETHKWHPDPTRQLTKFADQHIIIRQRSPGRFLIQPCCGNGLLFLCRCDNSPFSSLLIPKAQRSKPSISDLSSKFLLEKGVQVFLISVHRE